MTFTAAVVSALLLAAPAPESRVATVKERAAVRARPIAAWPVLGELAEGLPVMVSGDAKAGFLFVRSGGGLEGYVLAEQLQVEEAAPVPTRVEVAGEVTPRPAPDLQLRLRYVSSPEDLIALADSDPVMVQRAEQMISARRNSRSVMWGSVVVGALTVLASTWADDASTARGLSRVGLGTMAIGPVIGALMAPTRGDLVDAVDDWNAQHGSRVAVP